MAFEVITDFYTENIFEVLFTQNLLNGFQSVCISLSLSLFQCSCYCLGWACFIILAMELVTTWHLQTSPSLLYMGCLWKPGTDNDVSSESPLGVTVGENMNSRGNHVLGCVERGLGNGVQCKYANGFILARAAISILKDWVLCSPDGKIKGKNSANENGRRSSLWEKVIQETKGMHLQGLSTPQRQGTSPARSWYQGQTESCPNKAAWKPSSLGNQPMPPSSRQPPTLYKGWEKGSHFLLDSLAFTSKKL